MAPKRSRNTQDLEDAFIKVSFESDTSASESSTFSDHKDPMYGPWFEHGSGKFTDPTGFGVVTLRELYPNHSITPFTNSSLLSFPDALIQPVSPSELVSNLFFLPLGRAMGRSQGMLVDSIRFGSFQVAWDKYDFVLYVVRFPMGFGETTQQYLIHDGPDEPSRQLLLAAGIWQNDLHEEIYVFNQGFWNKDHSLWLEVQKARWEDVILKEEFKINLKKDVYGFFDSEELYKSLSIPWKRGIIMYGPPGNGKTISMKAIIKECDARGYTPLYVRSFQSWMGEEGSMSAVFGKARQMAPCVIVLEDLDSLINDRNRSFFLNELDGFEGNDGLLVIGSTNHFDRLDPGLSGRPSRFDRKYLFDDPDDDERRLYAKYWQNKLKNNKQIEFSDNLVNEIVAGTTRFSFAYLKEAFVSTLVLLAGWEGDKPSFGDLLKRQIRTLRDQLDKDRGFSSSRTLPTPQVRRIPGPPAPTAEQNQGLQRRFESRLPGPVTRRPDQNRVWSIDMNDNSNIGMSIPGDMPPDVSSNQRLENRRDVRSMALAAAALGRSFIA